MILIIDNYDSFTYNILHLAGPGKEVKVVRNDITLDEIKKLAPSHIIISSGPGSLRNAGINKDLINHFKGKIPIMGIGLGHLIICEVFGAKITRTKNYPRKTKLYSYSQWQSNILGLLQL